MTRQLFRVTRRVFNRWPNDPMPDYMTCFSLANQRALVTGVDGARSAKEFLVYLMDLEREFEEKSRAARELAATSGVSRTAEAIEEMSRNFYADLRERMEKFFHDDDKRRTPATGRV